MSLLVYNEKTGQVSSKKLEDSGIVRYENLHISLMDNESTIGKTDFCLAKTHDSEVSIEFLGATLLTATLGTGILLCIGEETHRMKVTSRHHNAESLWITYEACAHCEPCSITIKFVSGALIGREGTTIMIISWPQSQIPDKYILEKFW